MPGTRATDPIEWLNTDCFCITVDADALQRELDADAATRGLYESLRQTHAYLFSHAPIFVSRDNVTAMEQLVAAVETVVARPAYREAALVQAPAIARYEPGTGRCADGFRFSRHGAGPAPDRDQYQCRRRLPECRARAGADRLLRAGAVVAAGTGGGGSAAGRAVRDVRGGMASAARLRRRSSRVAIVDESPARQYLYPEFLLASQMFRMHGVEAVICDPQELQPDPAGLRHDGRPVDLVYNRLTDFAFEQPAHAALRDAYVSGRVVVTPNPRAHALYADKRDLALLSDASTAARVGRRCRDDRHAAARHSAHRDSRSGARRRSSGPPAVTCSSSPCRASAAGRPIAATS